MGKEMMKDFRQKAMDFFYTEADGVKTWNKGNLYAVLIGGFVGWLVLTLTLGARLKAFLKKIPVVNMLFKKKTLGVRRRRVRARGTIANPVPLTAYEEGLTKKQLIAYRAKRRRRQANSRKR